MSDTPRLDTVIATHRTVAFRPALVDIVGDVVTGLVLSQLLYWTPRATVERDGKMWIVKAAGDWWQECRVTTKQARRAIDLMVELGLVERNVWKWNGAPTTHMRVVPEAMERALAKLSDPNGGGETIRPGGQMEPPQGSDGDALEGGTLDTEMTSEMTSEKNPSAPVGAGTVTGLFEPIDASGPLPRTARDEMIEQAFTEFWKAYPRKRDRTPAFKAFRRALARGVDSGRMIEGANRYAAEIKAAGTRPEHVKYGERWINAEAWNNLTEETQAERLKRLAREMGQQARANGAR